MRNNHKKRKRHGMLSSKAHCIAALKTEVDREQQLREEGEKKVIHYRRMARSYWERWQLELHQRKEAMLQKKESSTLKVPHLLEIDHTILHDPIGDSLESEVQGSFTVVKMKLFRGIKVADKELQPRTVLSDVRKEAYTLAKLCHPHLPYLFGVCTKSQPYKIVMQFHSIQDSTMSLTLSSAFIKKISDSHAWLGISIQIMEVLSYIHDEVQILHNDIF